jgi:UDP-glucose 4-epimerase
VTNIAKALIGERQIKIVETGVRPGEKFDEVLVSEEEVNHTIRRGEYFVIRPALPELANGEAAVPRALDKELSSGDFVLNYDETVELLRGNDLMDRGIKSAAELLK